MYVSRICVIFCPAFPSPRGFGFFSSFSFISLMCFIVCLKHCIISFTSVPAKMFPPASTVSGRSVLYLSVMHGVLSVSASSCTPPLSVSTIFVLANSPRNLKYPSGLVK